MSAISSLKSSSETLLEVSSATPILARFAGFAEAVGPVRFGCLKDLGSPLAVGATLAAVGVKSNPSMGSDLDLDMLLLDWG